MTTATVPGNKYLANLLYQAEATFPNWEGGGNINTTIIWAPRSSKELSPQMRSRMCELHSYGLSYRKIHELYLEIPLSTIKYTGRKEADRLNCVSLPRSGRPRQLSEDDRDHLYEISTQNPHITMPDLLAEVDHKVKERAMRGLMRGLNRRKWLQRKRSHITAEHARKRLQWTYTYRNQDWKRVVWSDESTVERGAGVQPQWTFARPRDQLEAHDVIQIAPKGVSQMCWAAFRYRDQTGLVPLDGRVNRWVIYDLYASYLPDFIEPGDIFMQDNAPVHTAHVI